jgi:16S rRNA (adenine1518-N6/adenine1519-N6)-dimethyltransferase
LPRKLGQHFLKDEKALAIIAEAACGNGVERVIEIGPGGGALTRHLLSRTRELHAVELDTALLPVLEREFGDDPRFHLHHGDVLETDLSQWGPAAIAGNLPYYITSPIIERFLLLGGDFTRAVFLVQEEVADRLRAGPGSRDYGYLSVHAQLFCTVELVCKVPAASFSPPPKVDSAVVRMVRRPSLPENPEPVVKLMSRSFAHKRKTLRNNLRPFYPPELVDLLPEAGLRAEQLSIGQFIDLERRLRLSRAGAPAH